MPTADARPGMGRASSAQAGKDTDVQKLTASEILDLREYERVRADFRSRIIALKARRRVALGDILTLVFENTETMRFQVQEMARAEKMLRDEQIADEVRVYNELIPDDGELCGTLFIELTEDGQLREWLPRLVGIQRSVRLEVGDRVIPGAPLGEDRLTREDVTAAVHYLEFRVGPAAAPAVADALRAGPARIVVDHPAYSAAAELTAEQRAELARDLTA
jgi:hypothetical protein